MVILGIILDSVHDLEYISVYKKHNTISMFVHRFWKITFFIVTKMFDKIQISLGETKLCSQFDPGHMRLIEKLFKIKKSWLAPSRLSLVVGFPVWFSPPS